MVSFVFIAKGFVQVKKGGPNKHRASPTRASGKRDAVGLEVHQDAETNPAREPVDLGAAHLE